MKSTALMLLAFMRARTASLAHYRDSKRPQSVRICSAVVLIPRLLPGEQPRASNR